MLIRHAHTEIGAAVALALLCGTSLARAQGATSLDLPAQPLAAALKELAVQSRTNVLFDPGLVAGRGAPAVKARLTFDEALTRLLAGTGLRQVFVNQGTAVVEASAPDLATGAYYAMREDLTPTGPPVIQAIRSVSAATQTTAAAAAPATELQEVTVSASAISIAGYEAPTPVTTVGIQQLQSEARADIGDVMRSLPTFSGSPSAENSRSSDLVGTGTAGEDLLNLRNLGVVRTLVLFDGQRVVSSNIRGGVDLSTIPSSLISRVDTVTGGASAIWGSDALAGVVNLIINKNFNGAEINLQDGNNSQGLHEQYKAELTLGMPFADGAGHVEVAGSFWKIPNPYFTSETDGWASQRLVSNPLCSNYSGYKATCPAGAPEWLTASDVGLAKETTGGLITGPLKGYTGPFPFTNVAFGPGGVPYQFNPGNVSENFFSNGGTLNDEKGDIGIDGSPLQNETAFGLLSWKFNDALSASVQLNYGNTTLLNNSYTYDEPGSLSIYSGNPYIPAAIQTQMTALGVPGLALGTPNDNNVPGGGGSLGAQENSLGIPVNSEYRRLERAVFTLDGSIGPSWNWDAYVMRGESYSDEVLLNNVYKPNLAAAADAVLVTPAMNAADPALAVGSVTCAMNVQTALLPGGAAGPIATGAHPTGAMPGCQPLNVLGVGVASPQAISYVTGPSKMGEDRQTMSLFENVAAAKLQGELPLGLPAGPIAAAFGVVYRSESGISGGCAISCIDVLWNVGNFAPFGPVSYNIKEGNGELNIPVLKNQGVQSLSLDLAGRVSEYSTSGTVETYKFGLLTQLDDYVRLRASYSYDIRAPDLYELFANPSALTEDGTDPRTGAAVRYYGVTSGNPALQPEEGETRTMGLVLTPLQNMNVSVDWYYIRIADAINEGFGVSTVLGQCTAGNSLFCQGVEFGTYPGGCTGPSLNSCPAGPLSAVLRTPVNSDTESISGLDFAGDYRFPLGVGALDLSSVMNYIFEQRYTSIGFNCDSANGLGPDEATFCPIGGVPKFRGTVAATYSQGAWLGTLQTRMIGASHLVNFWTSGVQVDNNDIPFYWYFDARLSYHWDNGVTVYTAIDNIADKKMPVITGTGNTLTDFEPPYRDDIYDGFGRVWRVGLRAKF